MSSIFGAEDPIALARSWLADAEKSEVNDPNAMALATVDADGLPNVRMVLLKEIEDDAFVFYTNYESAKGRELAGNAQAAFVLHWKSLRKQVRVRGHVSREEGEQADAYYASRALDSRLGGLGVAPVAALVIAHVADGRRGQGPVDPRRASAATPALGWLSDRAVRNGILVRRGVPPS